MTLEETWPEYVENVMRRAEFAKQSALAVASGVGQNTISNYLLGKRQPDRADVQRLARAVAVKLAEINAQDVAQDDIDLETDRALYAAGFRPEGRALKVVPVENDQPTQELIYEVIIDDLEAAAQSGNLDATAIKRIRRQLQLEIEEVAERRGAKIVLPEE